MRKGKLFPFIVFGVVIISFIAIVGVYFFMSILITTQANFLLVLVSLMVCLSFFVLMTLLMNGKRRKRQLGLEEFNRHVTQQLDIIDRHRRNSKHQRRALITDVFDLVEELNKFITVSVYQRTKRSLLEARLEYDELNMTQFFDNGRKSKRRKQQFRQQSSQTDQELIELTLTKLKSMIIVGGARNSSDLAGSEQLCQMLEESRVYFEQEYTELSPYFASITTLFAFLNQSAMKGELTAAQYKSYIQQFRTYFTRNDLLILFLYCLLMPSGCQLAVELVGTSFFGELHEVGQNMFLEAPELFREYLETVFVKASKERVNKDTQDLIRYRYLAKQKELTNTFRNRKTALNRVLSGEYYVKNENGQAFLYLVDKLGLDG